MMTEKEYKELQDQWTIGALTSEEFFQRMLRKNREDKREGRFPCQESGLTAYAKR